MKRTLTCIALILIGFSATATATGAYQEFDTCGEAPTSTVAYIAGTEIATKFVMGIDQWEPLFAVRFHAGHADPSASFRVTVREAVWDADDKRHEPGELILDETVWVDPCPDRSGHGSQWTRGTRLCVAIAPGDTFFVGMICPSTELQIGYTSEQGANTDFVQVASSWNCFRDHHYMIQAVACRRGDTNEDDDVTSDDEGPIVNELAGRDLVFPTGLDDLRKDVDGDGVISLADASSIDDIMGKKLTLFGVRRPLAWNEHWDDGRKNAIKGRVQARQVGCAGNAASEDSVLAWCDQLGTPDCILYRTRSTKLKSCNNKDYQLTAVADTNSAFMIAHVDTIVDTAVDRVGDDYWDNVWGWLVWHEAYRCKQNPGPLDPNIWDRTQAMVDSLLGKSEFNGKYIMATGGASGFTDAGKDSMAIHFFRDKSRCIFGEQLYGWRYRDGESQATRDSCSIMSLMSRTRDMCRWAGEDSLKWYAYVQSHKSSTNPGGAKYRYVSRTELKWTSLCAVMHGAMGVVYYILDGVPHPGGTQTEWGMWDRANPDSSETMLCGAREARERLDDVARCLDGYRYTYTASSEPGYDWNLTIEDSPSPDTSWTNFGAGGKGWLIQYVTCEDPSDTKTWVEVCRWVKTQGSDEGYVILGRDTHSDHEVTVQFVTSTQAEWDWDTDGCYQGRGTYADLTIPKGDCVVLKLYQK